MQVDEARRDHAAGGVEHGARRSSALAHLDDDTVVDEHVGVRASPVASTTRPPLITTRRDGQATRPPEPSSDHRTAMRTATPFATCSVMIDAGPSATSAAISTPRFIGPGCMTTRVGLEPRGALGGQPVAASCTRAATGSSAAPEALALDAQQVDDVDLGEHVVEVVGDA